MNVIKYRPEIDGLRAVAVIPVILFHLNKSWVPSGYLGVDLFFVISGFLITSIILKEEQAGVFSFKKFWVRRAKRILPVLVAMVLAVLIAGQLLLMKGEHSLLGYQGLAALLSFANIAMWQTTGSYWGPQAENSPFLHTWSLSVEEQFYLLFPVLLILFLKKKASSPFSLILAFAIGSLLLFIYGAAYHPSATFYLLPTRAWELLCGCLLAIVNSKVWSLGRKYASWLGLCGLVLILASFFIVPSGKGVSNASILSVFGAALLIGYGQTGFAHTVLSLPPLVHIGKTSYSLYLWHWPAIVFAKYADFNSIIVPIIITILLSYISFYLIEKPVRFSKKSLLFIIIPLLAVLGFSALMLFTTSTYNLSRFQKGVLKGPSFDVRPKAEITKSFIPLLHGLEVPTREPCLENAFKNGGIIKNFRANADPQVVVLGDSHAGMWAGTIEDICKELKLTVSFYSSAGVSPFINLPLAKGPSRNEHFTDEQMYEFDQARLRFIQRWKPKLVILICRWENYKVEDTIDLLYFLEKNTQNILLIDSPPGLNIGDTSVSQFLCFRQVWPQADAKFYLPQGSILEYEKGKLLIQKLKSKFSNISVCNVADIYQAKDNQVLVLDGDAVLYFDDDHLLEAGAFKAREVLQDAISNLVPDGNSKQ